MKRFREGSNTPLRLYGNVFYTTVNIMNWMISIKWFNLGNKGINVVKQQYFQIFIALKFHLCGTLIHSKCTKCTGIKVERVVKQPENAHPDSCICTYPIQKLTTLSKNMTFQTSLETLVHVQNEMLLLCSK